MSDDTQDARTVRVTLDAKEVMRNERCDLIGRSVSLVMKQLGVKVRVETRLVGDEVVIEAELTDQPDVDPRAWKELAERSGAEPVNAGFGVSGPGLYRQRDGRLAVVSSVYGNVDKAGGFSADGRGRCWLTSGVNTEDDHGADLVGFVTQLGDAEREALVLCMRQLGQLEPETGHGYADDLLCVALRSLGHERLVAEFDELTKWYA